MPKPPAVIPVPTPSMQLAVYPLGRGAHGKTWLTRWMADRALSHGREIVIADADRTNATLSGYFANVVTPPSADERDMREWVGVFAERQINEKFNAIIDFGGGDLVLKRVAAEMDLVEFLTRHGIFPVAIHLIGPDPDDLAYLRDVEAGGIFAPPATILVLNEALVPAYRTPLQAFEKTVLKHPILTEAVDRGAKLISMPRLEPALEVDLRRLTFSAAEAGKTKEGQDPIGPWKRQQIAMWLRDMERAFEPVAHWLP
jgi:hypothetical protein